MPDQESFSKKDTIMAAANPSTTDSPLPSAAAISRFMIANDVCLLTLDTPGKSANVLTQEFLDELEQNLDDCRQRQAEIKGLVIVSAKPKIYIAGADLVRISQSLDDSDDKIQAFCRRGQQIFARLGQFTFPTVAAIHGICVGGGLELALACDYRVCSDARQTMLGLPEVNLGLIPGWCGTVRTPRLIGLKEALELVTTGRLINADEADALLLVDDVVPREELIERAAAFALDVDPKQLQQRRDQVNSPLVVGQVKDNPFETWQHTIANNTAVHPLAPEVAAEHMIRTASQNVMEAGHSEAAAMCKVWGSPSNRGLLHLFFVNEAMKKNPGWPNPLPDPLPDPKPVNRLGVLSKDVLSKGILSKGISENTPGHDAFLDSIKGCTVVRDAAEFDHCELVISIGPTDSQLPNLVGLDVDPSGEFKLAEIWPTPLTTPSTLATAAKWCRVTGRLPLINSADVGSIGRRLLEASGESRKELAQALAELATTGSGQPTPPIRKALAAALNLMDQYTIDPRAIDFATVHGLGFPRELGGMVFWADQLGLSQVASLLAELNRELPAKYAARMKQHGRIYP